MLMTIIIAAWRDQGLVSIKETFDLSPREITETHMRGTVVVTESVVVLATTAREMMKDEDLP